MEVLNRRDLVGLAAISASVGASPAGVSPASAAPSGKEVVSRKRALMKVGEVSVAEVCNNYPFLARFGVHHTCGWYDTDMVNPKAPTVEQLSRLRGQAAKHDIEIVMTNCFIGRGLSGIMLGDARRDKEIEEFQTTIKNCAAAGVPAIKYYLSFLQVLRSGKTAGRGDLIYNSWSYDNAKPATPQTVAGRVDADLYWERISYFLDRVVPVANEYKIRLAQHPHDPPMGANGYQGIDQVLGTVEGMKRFVSIRESPYHGLNFCQGTVAEMLQDPGREIYDVIRWFGERKKIFSVHFRNIKGHRGDFIAEIPPDAGDVNMARAMNVYRDVGYDGVIAVDHISQLADSVPDKKEAELQQWAYGFGYIRALIQAADEAG
jgi:mannonate dehydratase